MPARSSTGRLRLVRLCRLAPLSPLPRFSAARVHGGFFLAAFCRQAVSELFPYAAEPRLRVSHALRMFSLSSLPGARLRTPRPTYDLVPFGASDSDPKSVCVWVCVGVCVYVCVWVFFVSDEFSDEFSSDEFQCG